ncbi:ABC transporter ATP-binding protein [bacterium]|nr:ABC transporter ATP-binding protein [candidate division CSSED10-310 bacterium]
MLVIRNLVKVYPGPVSALQGISLELNDGMFGLLGPNGAGKTTLMRIIAGVLEPTSGSVCLDGQDITEMPHEVWCRLGYLPQEFGFFPNLTGEAMLAYLLKLKGVSQNGQIKQLCRELLDQVNLSAAAKRKLKTYSGGMRQRLGIAQALAGKPRLIIVDEPTAGLDPEERLRFYRLLAELAENRIILLSTHIVEDVNVLCPQFAVIRNGILVARTSPTQAKQDLEGSIFEGNVTWEDLESFDRSYCITQSLLVEGQNRIRVYLPEGNPPNGFHEVDPNLQDAYMVMMKMAAAANGNQTGFEN